MACRRVFWGDDHLAFGIDKTPLGAGFAVVGGYVQEPFAVTVAAHGDFLAAHGLEGEFHLAVAVEQRDALVLAYGGDEAVAHVAYVFQAFGDRLEPAAEFIKRV